MKIVSCNVNGIRAASKKGLLSWIIKENADVVCLQEIKAHKEQLPEELLNIQGYKLIINAALKKGYAGTMIYIKKEPTKISRRLNLEKFDNEGRWLKIEYEDFILINLYMPHGGRQKQNLGYKFQCYESLINRARNIKDKKVILIGDFNIAHKDIDLARPKQNKNNIMFTQEERIFLDKLKNLGFVDSFRKLNHKGGWYTWWPYAFNAKERNLGWRIDYIFISDKLVTKLENALILRNINISDHCPIEIEISS